MFDAAGQRSSVSDSTTTTRVAVDFGVGEDYPLSKTKFGVFNSGFVPMERYRRDIDRFAEVGPESLRIDLGLDAAWTGWTRPPIAGTADAPVYDLAELDELARLLNDRNVLPYWSYCYQFAPLQAPPGDWRSAPADVNAWGRILGDLARHYRDARPPNPVGYHEVYNEPDNDYFFTGTLDDYLAMYETGVRAIRANDPDAAVGGPALAFKEEWIAPFLDHVARHALPLDFFSFHWYAKSWPAEADLTTVLDLARAAFADRPEFSTTEFHLNEFNSYPIDYPQGGSQDKHPLAAALLRDYKALLARPEITLVHWAQFLDSGHGNYSGMVSIDGHRKAVFNAYKIYAAMPVDRRELRVDGAAGVDGMASADRSRAGVVLWNLSADDQAVDVRLDNPPFVRGTLRVYRIDAAHASWGDDPTTEELTPVETCDEIETNDLTWSGLVPPGGVLYLALDDTSGRADAPPNRLATLIRLLHFYPDRTSTAYADFDKNTWTFRLGMASERSGWAEVGVIAEDLPESIAVSVEVDGTLERIDADSLLGLRVDYAGATDYRSSVLFYGPYEAIELADGQRSAVPHWGTRRATDRAIRVGDLSAFRMELGALAPADWTGRAVISAIMRNAGTGTRATIRLRTTSTEQASAGDRSPATEGNR